MAIRDKVDFVVGGVQKAGTTALHEYLSQHPQMVASSKKELHFFDNEVEVQWQNPNYDAYHRQFPAGTNGLLFESTPIYLFWPPALPRIRRYHPTIKLVFIFRDPIERAFSHWAMARRRGWEDLEFEEALKREAGRLSQFNPANQSWRFQSYARRGFYGRQVRRLLTFFPREQLLFLSCQELAHSPEHVLLQITSFLGLEPFQKVSALITSESWSETSLSSLPKAAAAKLRLTFREDIREFSTLTAVDTSTWLTCEQ
jgi:hypothetical protein